MSCREVARWALLLALFPGCGEAGDRPRYAMARDSGSRHGFRYPMEKGSGLWVHLQCELRVALERPLPDPLRAAERGDLISFTQLGSISMGSAGIDPFEQEIVDGRRVWLWRRIANEKHHLREIGLRC